MKNLKKTKIYLAAALNLAVFTNCGLVSQAQEKEARSIKLAILLDTSNSMDGLIDQARAHLWVIVNELASAQYDGENPELQIALYEYGNDHLSPAEGYIRMVTPLTSDLDQISEDLFSLTTRGGQEFCGHVIQTSLNELDWSAHTEDYQAIFIAGNEPFTQGNVHFKEACAEAKRKGVIVNTIFCGPYEEGIRTSWKEGATLTSGDYFSIEQDQKPIFVSTPYDDQIVKLNRRLNDTYIFYGVSGRQKKAMQIRQDQNAASYGRANEVNRAVSKSSHVYKNQSWDLVDASESENFSIQDLEEESLPPEMQDLSDREKALYVEKKKEERENITREIAILNEKRTRYIAEKQKESGNDNMLDNAMLTAIKDQAKRLDYQFK